MEEFHKEQERLAREWRADKKQAIVFQRLDELGVQFQYREQGLTCWVPIAREDLAYIEIGFLFAQLCDTEYPDYFFKGFSEEISSKLFKRPQDIKDPKQPIRYRDSAPHGMKVHLHKKAELEVEGKASKDNLA